MALDKTLPAVWEMTFWGMALGGAYMYETWF